MEILPQDHYYLRLLELGSFQRRENGGWRFGTRVINDTVVERLLAAGRAKLDGNQVSLATMTGNDLSRNL